MYAHERSGSVALPRVKLNEARRAGAEAPNAPLVPARAAVRAALERKRLKDMASQVQNAMMLLLEDLGKPNAG